MEKQLQQTGVMLTRKEAEEYCAYKRQKKISEIMSAMRRVESVFVSGEDVAKTCERGARLKLAALQFTPASLMQWQDVVSVRPIKIDCIIGGDGETLPKVKGYEIKQTAKLGAREFTARVTPSLVACSRYTQLRKEIRKLRKSSGKAILKIRVEKPLPQATLSRLIRICGEVGVNYFSFPYFDGCERLQSEVSGCCLLEVSGVNTLPQLQKMAGAGMGRMITCRAWELYCEWVQEVEKIALEEAQKPVDLPPVGTAVLPVKKGEEKSLLLPPPQKENVG